MTAPGTETIAGYVVVDWDIADGYGLGGALVGLWSTREEAADEADAIRIDDASREYAVSKVVLCEVPA